MASEAMPTRRRANTIVSRIRVGRRTSFICDGHERPTTIGEHIDDIGFGRYQVHMFSICCGALMTEASLIQMVGSIVTPVSAELGVASSLGRSLFMSCLFIGIQIGTAFSGPLGDTLGRRAPMLGGYLGMIGFPIACQFAPSARTLYVLLLFTGLFCGISVPASLIMLSEVMPTKIRGISGAAIGIAFRIGWLWSAFGLLIFIPDLKQGPWRFMLLWAIFPTIAFFALALLSRTMRQESPHVLAVKGRGSELVRSINVIADMNGRPDMFLIDGNVITTTESTNMGIGQVASIMASYPICFQFAVQSSLFFCKEFIAAGTVSFWPLVWSNIEGFSVSAASELIITTLLSIPGVFLSMWLMHVLPRRRALAIPALVCGLSSLLMLFLVKERSAWQLGLLGVAGIQLFFPTWQMVVLLLPSEIFPVQVRCWAFSSSFFLGRFGDEVAEVVVNFSQMVFVLLCAAFAIASMGLVYLLPETKDCDLCNFSAETDDVGKTGHGRVPDKLEDMDAEQPTTPTSLALLAADGRGALRSAPNLSGYGSTEIRKARTEAHL